MLLALLSLTCYLRLALPELCGDRRAPTRGLYLLSFILFVLGMFSKTVLGSLPAVILLLIWWKRGRITVRDVMPLVPFFVVSIGMGSLTGYIEKHWFGTSGRLFELSVIDRLLIAGRA